MKIEIKNDLFDIANRLKQIDKDYFVLFNTSKKVFELHAKGQPYSSYCLTFPYTELDERAVSLALKTRAENKDKLIKEMEEENQKHIKAQQQKLLRSYYES